MSAAAIRLSPEQANPPLLVFGGTFDPVHLGHLGAVSALRDALHVETLIWLHVGEPPHRPRPAASAAHRLAMLQLALAGEPDCVIDTRELDRSGPSYTVLSLEELRAECGQGSTEVAEDRAWAEELRKKVSSLSSDF